MASAGNGSGRRRPRGLVVAVLAIGVGLVAAPLAFRMFERAPKGGSMLDDFRPYMSEQVLGDFRGWMDQVGAAHAEVETELAGTLDGTPVALADLGSVRTFRERWPEIDTEMGDMLDDMEASLHEFRAVDALPPFSLFPWFFVVPGVLVAGLGLAALRRGRPQARPALTGLAIIGIGLIAAPAVFQMFTRAPEGKEMIDTFRPLMTRSKVTAIQGHFLTMGTAEGELRLRVLPAAAASGRRLPAVETWVGEWPSMSNEMAPMIGAMADNLDNFAAVDALPPFSLFPWFFVVPGLLVAGLSWSARRQLAPQAPGDDDVTRQPDPPAPSSPAAEPSRSAP